MVTAEIKHSCTKKIKPQDQSLFRRREFPQLMNKVLGVYTAFNFYKLLQLSSMYYHNEVTLTSAKRENISTISITMSNNVTQVLCKGLQLLYSKLCIEDSSCHRTTLCRKSVYFTFFGPHISTYRELNHKTELTKKELEWKSRFYQQLYLVCSCHTEAQRKWFNTLVTPKVTPLELLPQRKKQLLKSTEYVLHNSFHSRKLSAPLFQYSKVTETHHASCGNKAS